MQAQSCLLLVLALGLAVAGFLGGDWLMTIWSRWENPVESKESGLGGPVEREEYDDDAVEDRGEYDYQQILHDFYKKYNPERLGDVPMILSRYSGNEKELFEKLREKYGQPVMVPQDRAFRARAATAKGRHEGEATQDESLGGAKSLTPRDTPSLKRTRLVETNDPVASFEDENSGGEELAETAEERPPGDGDDESEGVDVETAKRAEALEPDSSFDPMQESDAAPPRRPQGKMGKLKAFVVGFPCTGVNEIHRFLSSGLKWDVPSMLELDQAVNEIQRKASGMPEFNKFSDYDAIAGYSIAQYHEEIMYTYPDTKIVIAVRHVDAWYNDMLQHVGEFTQAASTKSSVVLSLLGTLKPHPILWKNRYQSFYDKLFDSIPRQRRKLVYLYGEQKIGSLSQWEWLRRFLATSEQHHEAASGWTSSVSPDPAAELSLEEEDCLTQLHKTRDKLPSGGPKQGDGQLKVLGLGLDATGGTALGVALKKVGLVVAHENPPSHGFACNECRRVTSNLESILSAASSSNFGLNGLLHGVDAVVSPSAAYFVQDILMGNPDLKVVLCVRGMTTWWPAVACKLGRSPEPASRNTHHASRVRHEEHSADYRNLVYGVSDPHEHAFKRRYFDYAAHVLSHVPEDRLLVLDIARSGDAWSKLCSFLRLSKCTERLMNSNFPPVDHGASCKY